ncbi:MAG: glycosyltransferase [Paracoccaceae bacterium]
MAEVIHATSRHPRSDIRVFHKYCVSLQKNMIVTSLLVCDDVESTVNQGVKVISIGLPMRFIPRTLYCNLMFAFVVFKAKPRLLHIHDPDLLPLAITVRLFGISSVYDIHENYKGRHEDSSSTWTFAKIIAFLFVWAAEMLGVLLTNASIAATESIKTSFPKSLQKKISTIHNYPLARECSKKNLPARNTIVYAGSISTKRGLGEMIDLMKCLPDTCKLFLAGRVADEESRRLLDSLSQFDNIEYLGELDRGDLMALYQRCDFGFCCLSPTNNYVSSIPTKLYEYLNNDVIPIVSDFQHWRKIFGDNGPLLFVKSFDAATISPVMEEYCSDAIKLREYRKKCHEFLTVSRTWESEFSSFFLNYKKLMFPRQIKKSDRV